MAIISVSDLLLIYPTLGRGEAEDWMLVRKLKRLPLTTTALKRLESKWREGGLTPEKGILKCAEEGWAGFDKGWLEQKVPASQPVSPSHKEFEQKAESEHERAAAARQLAKLQQMVQEKVK